MNYGARHPRVRVERDLRLLGYPGTNSGACVDRPGMSGALWSTGPTGEQAGVT